MATSTMVILVVLAGLLLGGVAVAILLRRRSGDKQGDSALQLLQQQLATSLNQQDQRMGQVAEQLAGAMENLRSSVNQQLANHQILTHESQKAVAERLEAAHKTIGDVKGQLGQLGQATQNILQVGTEVRKLQDILQSPKLRGGLGEWTLESLLAEVLPREHYVLQHRFKNGQTVDALVELAQGRVAIDAKFPLSNFQALMEATEETARTRARKAFLKDVRGHIDAIAEKYIVPEEGTMDFALMYIPAENVYYEATVLNDQGDLDVCGYARQKRVVLVSPNTLYAYLMVIATGLKGLQIERNAQLIRRQLAQIGGELELFATDFNLIGRHLNNAAAKHNEATRKLDQMTLRWHQISGSGSPDGEAAPESGSAGPG